MLRNLRKVKYALRLVPGLSGMSYELRLKELNRMTLEDQGRPYKILGGIDKVERQAV